MKRIELLPSLALPLGAAVAVNLGLLVRQLIAKWGNGDLEALYYKVIDGYLLVGLPLSLIFVGITGTAAFLVQRRAGRRSPVFQFAILVCLYVLLGLGLALAARFPVTQAWLLVVVPLLSVLGLAHGLLALLSVRVFTLR